MTDVEEENCQCNSKGLEENQTADKLLDFCQMKAIFGVKLKV